MPDQEHSSKPVSPQPVGPARDFANFVKLELERRRSSQKDFDADLFDEAVSLVLGKLKG
jgi:hypothetical protein